MPRPVLDETRIHPAIRERIANWQPEILREVQQAVAQHAVVVVGMKLNPFPRRVRQTLREAGIEHHYLEYGSYFSQWRPRSALKMWAGWPTFPMVFVNGQLVGGANDVKRLIVSGEMKRLLSAARV